jgi:hypothetical protein
MENKGCKTAIEKLRILNFGLWFFVFGFQILFIFGLCSCSSVLSPYVVSKRQKTPYDAELSDSYYRIKLKESGALDVLPIIQKPGYELLSQSRSVVASFGQDSEGYKNWFNMVAFDEVKLTAKRKYFFLVDERVKRLPGKRRWFLMEPKRGIMFDGQMVLEKSAFDNPRISEDEIPIAQLRQILRSLRRDIDELGQGAEVPGSDNRVLTVSGMLLNQTFGTILQTLDGSPALADKLSDSGVVEFDHISFGKGTIRMVVEDDIATVKIRVGVFVGAFEDQGRELTVEEEAEGIDLEDYQ